MSIIGGHAASIGEDPWLAFIAARGPGGETGFSCTGTVVAPRVVLTAGHCVYDLESRSFTPASEYLVITGVANVNQARSQNVSQVVQTVLNPGFSSSTLRGDAGLLILKTPIGAPALSLASAADLGLLTRGTPVDISGWGLTNPSGGAPAELQAASTAVQSSGYCQQQVSRYYPFFSAASQFCAINPPNYATGTCHGDSGGPAVAYRSGGIPVEIGVTSLVGPSCATTFPDVFTRTDLIAPWVQRWIAAVEGDAPSPAPSEPVLSLPLLTFSRARQYVAQGLGEDFHHRYRQGVAKRTGCERIEREKVKCGVSWYQGGNDYYGTVTVYYLTNRETVLWNDRYKIHWVDERCWFYSGHRQSCVTHTKTR
jgi:secreted trypsin-like serine protease